MYEIDFTYPVPVHFIGIGGISMSSLAELLFSKGFDASGSDLRPSKVTLHLEELGIKIYYGQRASNITSGLGFIVYTAAVKEDNLEYQAAIKSGVPVIDRAELLGQLMGQYADAINVSGTHGKTTCSYMLSLMLLAGGLDPTVSVGGLLKEIGGNLRIGNSGYFVAEACEYTNSFLKFRPTHEIILNIEAEHLDFFKDIDDIRRSFRLFAEKLNGGYLVVNGDIPMLTELTSGLNCKVITFGIPDENTSQGKQSDEYDCYASDIAYNDMGLPSFNLFHSGQLISRIQLSVPGRHNILNCLAAAAMALVLGVSADVISESAAAFKGTERRLENKGVIGGVTIIDDYAHHPSEITASLSAAMRYPHRKLWCVFQPHTYSRTKLLFNDFIGALSLADELILTDIYPAREKDPGDISSKDLAVEFERRLGRKAYYFPSFDETENFILENCQDGDLLITMGAGDVVMIGEALLGK